MFRNPEGGTARSQRQGRARRGIHEMAIIHEWVCPCGTLSGSSPTLHCPLYGLRIVSFMDEQPGAPFFISFLLSRRSFARFSLHMFVLLLCSSFVVSAQAWAPPIWACSYVAFGCYAPVSCRMLRVSFSTVGYRHYLKRSRSYLPAMAIRASQVTRQDDASHRWTLQTIRRCHGR